jgi:hypothetical protein
LNPDSFERDRRESEKRSRLPSGEKRGDPVSDDFSLAVVIHGYISLPIIPHCRFREFLNPFRNWRSDTP